MTERDLPTEPEPVDEEDEEVDQLYEHYAITADQGQEPLRVDRSLLRLHLRQRRAGEVEL